MNVKESDAEPKDIRIPEWLNVETLDSMDDDKYLISKYRKIRRKKMVSTYDR